MEFNVGSFNNDLMTIKTFIFNELIISFVLVLSQNLFKNISKEIQRKTIEIILNVT